jgi:ubiquinone/menaquinone biosynthesis C-methylase UbiE
MLSISLFHSQNNDRGLLGPLTAKIRKEAAKLVASQPGRLLDVCCGNGLFFSLFGGNGYLKLYGLDRSKELIEEAHKMSEEGHLKKVSLFLGDAMLLPFKRNYFQRVVCLNTLLNFQSKDDLVRILSEIREVIENGGQLIIDVRNKNNPLIRFKYWWHQRTGDFPTVAYELREISELLENVGFKVRSYKSIGLLFDFVPFVYIVDAVKQP